MGLDLSEERLCDYRCMTVFDAMNNWTADQATPPKYMTAIAETYVNRTGDDFYANTPVTYLKPDGQLTGDNWAPIVNSLKKGTFFATSGEVLISSYDVQGTGRQRTIAADIEWTFPLEFAEVVWGDGQKTDRQIIRLTRSAGVRNASLPDSVRCHRQEVGAVRSVGLGRQRRLRPAGQAGRRHHVDIRQITREDE